jgi:hypothetical protein
MMFFLLAGAPKRGKSPYIYFSMAKREAVKAELGEKAPG